MPVRPPDSLPELAAVVEVTEGAAYADLLHAAPPEWGCVAEETACGWLLMAPPLDMLLFNPIVGCGVREPARSAPLLDLLGRFRDRGLRNFGVQHGAQSALLAQRIADASAMGCSHVITETSEELPHRPNASFRNMMRAGFAVVYHRPNYMIAV